LVRRMNVLDFNAAKAARDGVREVILMLARPWASLDDLPDLTLPGQAVIKEYIASGKF
jgi:hypothetical protein